MIDFDKDFERFLTAWYARNAEKVRLSGEAPEDLAPDVYAEWAAAPNPALGGRSPKGYFDSVQDPEELIRLFLENPCALLYERITAVKECTGGLTGIVAGVYGSGQKIDAVNLLNESGAKPPVELYAKIVASPASDPELADLCTEILSEYAAEAASFLFDLAKKTGEAQKARIAEILLCAPPDERTYALITELFENGSNIPLYAGYLGKYGDERAAELLFKRLPGAGYADYIEIKNAIERLGGIVEEERDFSDDRDYIIIKSEK